MRLLTKGDGFLGNRGGRGRGAGQGSRRSNSKSPTKSPEKTPAAKATNGKCGDDSMDEEVNSIHLYISLFCLYSISISYGNIW